MNGYSYSVGELKALIAESSQEFKAVLGPNVERDNKKNNSESYKESKKRAEDFDGGKGAFAQQFKEGDTRCFYRLYNNDTMNRFLTAYQHLLKEHGTLGSYVRQHASDGLSAVKTICDYFAQQGISVVVPKDTQSACKRVCMFLRWMVRSGSPVDIGLWADFIDRRTIIMPMDTHVLNQSMRMGLLKSRTTSMSSAIRLTAELAKIFPDDPLKGDFALFGYGVNEATSSHT